MTPEAAARQKHELSRNILENILEKSCKEFQEFKESRSDFWPNLLSFDGNVDC